MRLFSNVIQESELKKQKQVDSLSHHKRELGNTKDSLHKTWETLEKYVEIEIDGDGKLNLNF